MAELEPFCGVSLTNFWNDGALGKLGDGERREAAFERKKPKNPKYTRHCPAFSHEATTKSKSTKALTPEGKARGPQQLLLPLSVPSTQAPQHSTGRGLGEIDERPNTLTGCLHGGVKAGISPLELPSRSQATRLFAALSSVERAALRALEFHVAALVLVWGS